MPARSTLIAWLGLLAGVLLYSAPAALAQDEPLDAEVQLLWPEEDHVRPPGIYTIEGRYTIISPSITFGSAGFIINNTPYYAVTYAGDQFALELKFRPGEYLIEAFIVDTEGFMYPGEAHTLWIKDGADVAPPDDDGEAEPPDDGAGDDDQQTSSPLDPAFMGEGLEVYLDFDGTVDGQPWGSFFSFPPYEPDVKLEPQVTWEGNHFEAFLYYEMPSADLWDEVRKVIAKTHWEIRYRVFGTVAADQQSLESITFEYQAQCRRDDDYLWEYYEGHFALTNVPGEGRVVSSNNPLASAPPTYIVEYNISGDDRSTLDHVLELTYRHGYPAYPETEYAITTPKVTRVNFRFNGW